MGARPVLNDRGLDKDDGIETIGPECASRVPVCGAVALIWGLILGFHVLNGLVTLVGGVLHLLISRPALYASIAAAQLPVSMLVLSGCGCLGLALLHARAVWTMLRHSSIRRRRWRFTSAGGSMTPKAAATRTAVAPAPDTSKAVVALRRRSAWWWRLLTWPLEKARGRFHALFDLDAPLGLYGEYFFVYYGHRELVEVLGQSYQAYSMSRAVDDPGLGRLVVALVAVNALTTGILRIALRHRRDDRRRRLLTVLIDLSLDFASAVVVPGALLLPLLAVYDWRTWSYPPELALDFRWSDRAIAVVQQVLVTSVPDLLSTLMPHFGLVVSLGTLKRFMERHRRERERTRATSSSHRGRRPSRPRTRTHPPSAVRVESSWVEGVNTHPTATDAARSNSPKSQHTRLEAFFLVATIAIAATAVVIHSLTSSALASYSESFRHCLTTLRPWLATRPSCAIVNVDCAKDDSFGSGQDITRILDPYDRELVTVLIFSHCPALIVPRIVREFASVRTLIVYNSTLADWPLEAAVSRSHQPRLFSLDLLNVNMSTVPVGLASEAFPRFLDYMSIVYSNLSVLPPSCWERWSQSEFRGFGLEFTNVASIPSRTIHAESLSLTNHRVHHIPDELFVRRTKPLRALEVSGHSLQELPLMLGPDVMSSLTSLMAERTNISRLDTGVLQWLDGGLSGAKSIVASFYGSPICANPAFLARYAMYCATDHGSDHDDVMVRIRTQPLRLE